MVKRLWNKLLCICLICALLLTSCTNNHKTEQSDKLDRRIKIGIVFSNNTTKWTDTFCRDLTSTLIERGYSVTYANCDDTNSQEVEMRNIAREGVDYILFQPYEMEESKRCFDIAKNYYIPVIVISRTPSESLSEDDYIAYVGPNYIQEGEMCATWLRDNILAAEINIIEITGRSKSSSSIQRSAGFANIVQKTEKMNIIASEAGDSDDAKVQEITNSMIRSYGSNFNAVFVHTDDMALRVIQALKAANISPGRDVFVVSINGMREMIQKIIDGEASATITCTPYTGEATANLLDKIVEGKEYDRVNIITDWIIDEKNCQEEILSAY